MLESNPLQAPLGLGHYLACRQFRRRKIISFRNEFPPLARKSKRRLVRGCTHEQSFETPATLWRVRV